MLVVRLVSEYVFAINFSGLMIVFVWMFDWRRVYAVIDI